MQDQKCVETIAGMMTILTRLSWPAEQELTKKQLKRSAVTLMPGYEEKYRVTKGIKFWQDTEIKYLLIAGTRGDSGFENNDIALDIGKKATFIKLGQGRMVAPEKTEIKLGGYCANTKDQMLWLIDCLGGLKIDYLILATAAYYLPRCWLTCLQTLKTNKIHRLKLFVKPLCDPENPILPVDKILEEAKKIEAYRTKGDVASVDDLRAYLVDQHYHCPS
ncbi:MAG: hypothetical protein COY09_02680 [Candidatus Portnoybacteria bacterium CG_4_10_14_0_2_um_filter_39_11]|uniref:DUF218 domain-containing protein n=1 Tax=Candidatus Portnoybacteria bacterium CG_4_10_14_0_2_um_filter_39_11 TaxID=1974797 RepID=A0A2M7UH55_9BACT|nr:MAG: hypothetical protein AUJ33_02615 [Parcubacteria group bacterium CG1_02_40_25]PIZ70545.1 MAG: hypothetical protein COY09_02680 [Candidatus Portnoybacteria bacterium CG_4_10_14_0_2_um_filter_39_11]